MTLRTPSWLRRFGPGLITGAADDDPSGIATYSQAGAGFGVHMLWTVLFTYPLMVAIQLVCARIGRVTGEGLASNMARLLPRPAVMALVALLCLANIINIGADLLAMGAATRLLMGGSQIGHVLAFAGVSLLLQIFVPYHRYVQGLKWLTLSLFSYVAVLFAVKIDWEEVARGTFWPDLDWNARTLTMVVAIFGTTISPYLFFWQSAEEVEDSKLDGNGTLLANPGPAPDELARMRSDTLIGMGFSNLVAFFIILTTAMTLHKAGITEISTSAEAAEALRPVAGDFAFLMFALGIIGTGLLALPVLAGACAYAVAELRGWPYGLELPPNKAPRFYGVIALAMALGLCMLAVPVDPIRALFWSAVLNGVIAVPLMAATLLVASSPGRMGGFTIPPLLKGLGWLGTGVMAAAALAMLLVSRP